MLRAVMDRAIKHRTRAAMIVVALVLGTACKQGSTSSGSSGAQPATTWSAFVPAPPAPAATPTHPNWEAGVKVHLERLFDGGRVVSFGLPLPRWAHVDPARIRVRVKGAPADLEGIHVKPLLYAFEGPKKQGAPRSILIQVPASAMTGKAADLEIGWNGGAGPAPATTVEPFSDVRHESPEVVETAERAIEKGSSGFQLVDKNRASKVLHGGWEPNVMATFPEGYVAASGIVGEVMPRGDVLESPRVKGLAYLSDNFGPFVDGAVFHDGYASKPEAVPDPTAAFEAWLYDRCATFLMSYAHSGTAQHLRNGYRACSYYASKIGTSDGKKGIFLGKPDPDVKYSHLRGLYAYYALTGDESAVTAARAIADMWLDEKLFAAPYRKGSVRGGDKQWTERLLAVSFEAMIYGYLFFGDTRYLAAFGELFETAYKHISTKNQAELDAITKVHFPPQDCFVHSGEQHGDADGKTPWCSGWMSELVVDPLLRFQELTGDARVDDIFVRLTRSMRDNGTNYFHGNPLKDNFLKPSQCWVPNAGDQERILIPLYGFGVRADGKRDTSGEWSDFEHCADVTALVAVGIRGLKRLGKYDAPGVAPFKTEGESFVALHNEFSECAALTFTGNVRPGRDPRHVRPAELAEGFSGGDPKAQGEWLEKAHIGYPVHSVSPMRKLSWWFNASMLQYRLLDETGLTFPAPHAGFVQPPSCGH
jgi:hypothetical protein